MVAHQDAFHVSLGTHCLSGLVQRFPRFWRRLADWETSTLAPQLAGVTIDRPVYVAGLARAGTTVLLEFLARHASVATHQYRDFPLGLFVPRLWSQGRSNRPSRPRERAHGDGLRVTPESPEAMEEVLWMAFFPGAHDPRRSNVLTAEDGHHAFEAFYRDHIRKLLFVRQRTRYVSKGNYNVCRLAYLQRLLPGARFVIPVRHPRTHVASLVRQQERFCAGQRRCPRALEHVRRVGHFEFGLDRRPIHLDDGETVRQIEQLWQAGDEVRGWARYWAYVYGWLFHQLEADARLAAAARIVRYEDLCRQADTELREVLRFCNLEHDALANGFARGIRAPDYYQPAFSPADEAALTEETEQVARLYGYDGESVSAEGFPPPELCLAGCS